MKKLLVVLLTVLFILTGCSNGGGSNNGEGGGTYVYAQDGEPATLNPNAIGDDYNYPIVQNLFPRLYKLTNAFTAAPDLAYSYDLTDDALTYTFHLQDDAVWTDGEKVTSADVLYTFNEIVDKNYEFASVFADVKSMTAPDDYTVVIELNNPDGSFLYNLAWYGTFILPKHVLEGKDWLTDDFNNNPVTCGPFKFEEWNKGTDVRIVRDDNYYGDQKAILDRVIYVSIPDPNTQYQAWVNGEVDEISSAIVPPTELEGIIADTEHYTTVVQRWPSPWYITFNLTDGPFADPKVREAVMYGVDREDVSQKATGGYKPKIDYFIPDIFTDSLNDDAKEVEYDLEKAQALLEEAGYTKNADGYYFECTFTVMSGFDDFCKVIADNMEKMGIKVTLDVLDYNIWVTQCLDDYNFEITALAGFEGPDVLGTTRRWTTNGSVNVARYSNAEVDALAVKAASASTDAERNEAMKEIQVHLREDLPMILIVAYDDYQPLKKGISGHPYVPVADGGSMEIAGFSEMTYVSFDR